MNSKIIKNLYVISNNTALYIYVFFVKAGVIVLGGAGVEHWRGGGGGTGLSIGFANKHKKTRTPTKSHLQIHERVQV